MSNAVMDFAAFLFARLSMERLERLYDLVLCPYMRNHHVQPS